MYTLEQYEEYCKNEPVEKKAIRQQAEADLVSFIKLVAPKTVLGHVHEELCDFWQHPESSTHTMALIPRDHQKSRMKAYETAWQLTKDPARRHIYMSATANLAEKQLYFIKQIFESPIHRHYWPFHIWPEVGKRTKWTSSEIYLDHPLRDREVRDASIFACGLTATITGLHADQIDLDDVVVMENAYSDEGRSKVATQCSLLVSILAADGVVKIVGTRYHPKDQYAVFQEQVEPIYDDETDEIVEYEPIYQKFERAVENRGDGLGEFCWPRQQREDGKWFGFDRKILARKRAQYSDRTQYYAQYYNNPNNPESEAIGRDKFQYYDPVHLSNKGGQWYYGQDKLNIIAAVDFNYSVSERSDFTAIAIIGMDRNRNYYILDIARFQTDAIRRYYEEIFALYTKWGFRKIVCETVAAQQAIVKELRNSYVKPAGLALSIIEHKPLANSGSKEARMQAILEPKYDNYQVFHYRGGHCQILEDELVMEHPPHDDVKDAVANAMDHLLPPTANRARSGMYNSVIPINSRFGGVSAR